MSSLPLRVVAPSLKWGLDGVLGLLSGKRFGSGVPLSLCALLVVGCFVFICVTMELSKQGKILSVGLLALHQPTLLKSFQCCWLV